MDVDKWCWDGEWSIDGKEMAHAVTGSVTDGDDGKELMVIGACGKMLISRIVPPEMYDDMSLCPACAKILLEDEVDDLIIDDDGAEFYSDCTLTGIY